MTERGWTGAPLTVSSHRVNTRVSNMNNPRAPWPGRSPLRSQTRNVVPSTRVTTSELPTAGLSPAKVHGLPVSATINLQSFGRRQCQVFQAVTKGSSAWTAQR